MKTKIFLSLTASLAVLALGTAKKPLNHDSFDSWQKLKNYPVSNDGTWGCFAVQPQAGDDTLYLHNFKTGKDILVPRGKSPVFSADSKWAVMMISPTYQESRQAKIDKKTGADEPKDSLAIVNLKSGQIEKIGNVESFDLGTDGGNWMAYQSGDTIYASKADLEASKESKPLVIRSFDGRLNKVVKWVKDYTFSKPGDHLAMTVCKPASDSISTDGIGVILFPDTAFYLVDRDKKNYGTPVFDETGDKLAYVAGNDSVDSGTKRLQLYMADMKSPMATPKEFPVIIPGAKKHLTRPPRNSDGSESSMIEEWSRRMQASQKDSLFINQYSMPEFSHDGKRLVIGVAPYVAPDDTTIVTFERASLDIWRWDSPITPPQEQRLLEQIRSNQYPVVINLATGNYILTTDNLYSDVLAPDQWDKDWALVADASPYMIERQWNYLAPEDLNLLNIETGEKRFVHTAQQDNYELSPADRYVVWYQDRNFYIYSIATGETVCATKGIPYPVWEEEDDHPAEKQAYGVAGWAEDDEYMFVYDRYDIWALDPTGKKAPFCLTKGVGREKGLRFRYVRTDPEERFIKRNSRMLLSVFDYTTKKQGLATLKYEGKATGPEIRLLEGASFSQLRKAKNADTFTWQRASFDIAPNIWGVTSLNFGKAVQLSDANPQMKDYSWGTAQLFQWDAYDGKPAEGVLYLPEDFSPEKEYPMLVVFYETASEDLYYHYAMEPSWSWVNYPFYVSRGYVVFVPDIHYTPGLPGESAYNYVCSGTEAVCDMYPNIDRKRIGIDGQSWGGYQTAYLVTRTNMFACAGSGAPVSNMTSAFGGIRWESGDSRQAQYEQGQSRIGANLWEKPELYIANSPLFRADRCETPLLIMHNDGDGAVPWYQGIELFMALRRLHKPVWMLQYNGEAHNIKERRNRKDITIRLQQFFDHYLKGEPMPHWMKEGINPLRKGQEMGY